MSGNKNFFALLGDDENDNNPTPVHKSEHTHKAFTGKKDLKEQHHQAPAKLPSKPPPPAEAVREAQSLRGRGRAGARPARGRGRGDYEQRSDWQSDGLGSGRGREGWGGGRGRRGGYGFGREENAGHVESADKEESEAVSGDAKKEIEEEKEMTLEEYEKTMKEKRKALAASKSGERKVKLDKSFKEMHLVDKKNEDDFFIKLGSEKGSSKKLLSEKEDKAKKAMSINEFLKPADVDRGRGRGRGRGSYAERFDATAAAADDDGTTPAIQDPGQFPELGKK